jgi:hypothetical protein
VVAPRAAFTLLFIGALLAIPCHALGAVCNASVGPKHDFEFLAGYSPASSTWIGRSEDRRFALAGFAYSYKCWTAGAVDISYTVGVLPLTFLFLPAQPNFRSMMPQVIPAHAVYGAAMLPVGFTAHVGRHAVQPFFAIHGGIIASTEPIPVNTAEATGLNFLFDISPGVRIKINEHQAVNLGYKFLHISNAYTTNVNPGVDNNVIFIGFSLLR